MTEPNLKIETICILKSQSEILDLNNHKIFSINSLVEDSCIISDMEHTTCSCARAPNSLIHSSNIKAFKIVFRIFEVCQRLSSADTF